MGITARHFLQEEEVLAEELDYEIGIPCVVQCGFLWFPAPSGLNVKLDVENTKIVKYHAVTNLAIEAAIKAPVEDVTLHASVFCGQLPKSWMGCLMRTGIWTRR